MKFRRQRGPRGLDRDQIAETGMRMFAEEGEQGFSVRRLAMKLGIDPMTILHHFGSKEGLMREIADRALATVDLPEADPDWRARLMQVARAYRKLAHRFPKLFHLHFRYHATGPADHASSEMVYSAMRAAGLDDRDAAHLGLGFYGIILGFSLAEVEGLLRPINAEDEGELTALDAAAYPATRALVEAFKVLEPDLAFEGVISAFIAGIAARRPQA